MTTETETAEAVEFTCDDRGLLVTLPADADGKHQAILVPRAAVSNASRLALQSFQRTLDEVHSYAEIAPGDVVIAAEDRTLAYGHGLCTQIRRGQKIDNLAWIEQLCREGCRLLRSNPESADDTQIELLRQALLDQSYLGMAQNLLVARRAAAAAGN